MVEGVQLSKNYGCRTSFLSGPLVGGLCKIKTGGAEVIFPELANFSLI